MSRRFERAAFVLAVLVAALILTALYIGIHIASRP